MLEKLEKVETRYEEVQLRLCDPEIVTDQAQYKKLMQEAKRLAPIVEKYRQFKAARDTFQEAKALLDAGGLDKEFHDMVFEELEQARAEMERTQEELKVLLLPRDPNDEKNVIVEIRGGAGGEEAALFAHSLFRMYSMYADARRWRVEVDSVNETELGGVKEICFTIEGDGAWSRLNSGTFHFRSGRKQRFHGTIYVTDSNTLVRHFNPYGIFLNPAMYLNLPRLAIISVNDGICNRLGNCCLDITKFF